MSAHLPSGTPKASSGVRPPQKFTDLSGYERIAFILRIGSPVVVTQAQIIRDKVYDPSQSVICL